MKTDAVHSVSDEQINEHALTTRSLKTAFALNFSFALLEIVGGLWTNSVAILSDAVHDLGDSLSLGSAWYLEKFSQRRRNVRYTYGYRRFSVLGALINAVILLGGSLLVLSEAIPRIWEPETAKAEGMILFAVIGIIVNGLAVLRLRGRTSLNVSVVTWHLLEDVLGWTAVLVVAIVLLFSDLYILDPILSVIVTLYILYHVVRNLRTTLTVFLQAAPQGIEVAEIERQINGLKGIQDIHHTHIWSLDGEHHVLTTHVVLSHHVSADQVPGIKKDIRTVARNLGIWHTTLEIESGDEPCEDEDCE